MCDSRAGEDVPMTDEPSEHKGKTLAMTRSTDSHTLPHRYLVVARHDRDPWPLVGEAARILAGGPASFHVLVAADPGGDELAADPSWRSRAEDKLANLERAIGELGGEVSGAIGDERVGYAVENALRYDDSFDAVLAASPRSGARHGLDLDLAAHLHRTFDIPVIEAPVVPSRPE